MEILGKIAELFAISLGIVGIVLFVAHLDEKLNSEVRIERFGLNNSLDFQASDIQYKDQNLNADSLLEQSYQAQQSM